MKDEMQLKLASKLIDHKHETILWQFVRGDMLPCDFEEWVYSDKELELAIGKDFYLKMIICDYKSFFAIDDLKSVIYSFLIRKAPLCLCNTFPNNTLLYPFDSIKLKHQINLFEIISVFQGFAGKSPVHESRWYHPGKVAHCIKCSQYWFMIFEESEGLYYYLVRLNEKEVITMNKNPNWPNESWPSKLKDWHSFISLNYISWNNIGTYKS